MDELRVLLQENLNTEFLSAVLSNPRIKDGTEKVKVRPLLKKGTLFFQVETFRNRQAFHENLTAPQACEALARQIEEQLRERVSPFAFSKCGISEGAELEFCCRGNEQPASAAPSPTTSMCAFRTKYGPWPHWRSICWGPGIRSPGLSISNTTARG